MKFVIDLSEEESRGCHWCPLNYDSIQCSLDNGPDAEDIHWNLCHDMDGRPKSCPLVPLEDVEDHAGGGGAVKNGVGADETVVVSDDSSVTAAEPVTGRASVELRSELRKRDISFYADDADVTFATHWTDSLGRECIFVENVGSGESKTMLFTDALTHNVTAAQAVTATVGAGTCREVKLWHYWRGCGECGYNWENMYAAGFQAGPNFCPRCGKAVVARA